MTKLRPQSERRERRRATDSPSRTYWYSWDLSVVDEPLLWALVKYRQKKNRIRFNLGLQNRGLEANLISSNTHRGTHLPILDLDFPHIFSGSKFEGRSFLYIEGMVALAPRQRLQRTFNALGLSKNTSGHGNLQIDVPVEYVPSTHKGHAHLYINHELTKFQWVRLMVSLYRAGILELGYFVWSLRRGGNFVRTSWTEKQAGSESGRYTYGWIFKLRDKR